MFLSLFKFKFFKYYILIILFILLVNVIILLCINFNPELSAKREKLQTHHPINDVYEERGSNKINKNYENNARKAANDVVGNEIHQDILDELGTLDKYFLMETQSEYIQNKFKNLVNQLRIPGRHKQGDKG